MINSDPVNILLVDDQPGKLLSYEAILSELGENLIKASSGREALEHLLRNDITVVLMDVSMPELDGFELADLIRQHPRYQKTAIIFVSAVHLSDMDRLKGYESGAVDYVSVPINPDLLRAKVSVFAELYRKTRDSERLTRELEYRVAARTAELEASMQRQKALTEQLRDADRRKDEFLALLAHELRNPLAPMLNALDILRLREGEDAQVQWCRTVIERQTRQLARLVDDLLDVSRITLGKVRLRRSRVDLTGVIRAVVDISRPLIDARGHELVLTLPEEPVFIEGDQARLNQVVANLLNNAAKYQQSDGRIEVRLDADSGEAVLRVRDRGIGIADHMLGDVFELFFQGQPTLDRAEGGLGIGLSVVKSVVELHGGSVTARSAGIGRGSEFVVRLPCLAQPVRPSPAPPAETPQQAPARARRVLVVDDSTDAAESLAMLLTLRGHEVHTAHDGIRALEIALAERPDVLLLDIGLPGLDGYEVCRRARAGGLADALIVAMTGYGQERDRERSKKAGFDVHTVKPVDFDELERLLTSYH